MIFGESGGIGRPNNDVVVGQCDPIAERERKLLIFIFFCREQCWRSGILLKLFSIDNPLTVPINHGRAGAQLARFIFIVRVLTQEKTHKNTKYLTFS